jgi:hypothetical protein
MQRATWTSLMGLVLAIVGTRPLQLGAQDSPPCSGTAWHVIPNHKAAEGLRALAVRMAALADSSRELLMSASSTGEYEDATPDFYTGPAEIARRAATYNPDDPTTLLSASRLALRAGTLGEGQIDTILGRRALCYANRALEFSIRGHDAVRADSARALLRGMGRPQLKRDPLGGALPPHEHSYLDSFDVVFAWGRQAPRRAGEPPLAARRGAPDYQGAGCPEAASQLNQAHSPWAARRARASGQGAPSNTRLELAAPGGQGRIPFVTDNPRRRSSSAGR